MHQKLPLELIFLILRSVDLEETPTLLSLILVSRTLKSVAEPLLYGSVSFCRSRGKPDTRLIRLRSFLENITKNNGVLGTHVRKFALSSPPFGFRMAEATSDFWVMILQILPFLTGLAHFEMTAVSKVPQSAREGIFSSLRMSQLSTFIWDGEEMDNEEEAHEFIEFLHGHPSIEHLEVPLFSFSSPIHSPELLPCLKKLVVTISDYLLNGNHPALHKVTHLGLILPDTLSLGAVDVEAEGPFYRIEYLAMLDAFECEDIMMLSSRLPNLKCLVYSPDTSVLLEEFLDEAQAHQFLSKRLEYLVLSCTTDEEEFAGQVIAEIFNAISTLRIVDFWDDGRGHLEFDRYLVDGTSSRLPLSKFPRYWPTERDLNRMLLRLGHVS
ncbi:hypothetical protein ONZ45_g11731 [Pleurotus djamor]|nr:hypothetical protein ONZ45_g11731 [Pleurotus djamor]